VYADDSSNPVFVAADLLSQAEHGPDSQVILVSTSEAAIGRAVEEVLRQLEALPRKEIARQALSHSKAFLVQHEDEAMQLLNAYAAEHLILAVDHASQLRQENHFPADYARRYPQHRPGRGNDGSCRRTPRPQKRGNGTAWVERCWLSVVR
jgi:hypothetical protein